MGYMRHHAIVVTSWNDDLLKSAHKEAMKLFPLTTEITIMATNGYKSFLVPPDGSKEGWDESDDGDTARDAFVEWLDSTRYDDGSSALDWVEVQFGDDNRKTKIVRHSDESKYF